MEVKIVKIEAQELLDSRGNPTVGTEITVTDIKGDEQKVLSMVPSGASTGMHEALELRDGDPNRYHGKGVLTAVRNVNERIAPILIGKNAENQEDLDELMLNVDWTENKSNLGANAILSVSMAIAEAAAAGKRIPLYQHVAELFGNPTDNYILPVPMMNVLNGGKHAVGSSDMQEFMIVPVGAPNFAEAVRYGSEIFHTLGKILKEKGERTTVGDEGGYAPKMKSNEEPLRLMMEAIEKAGYEPGEEIFIALDPAASEFYKDGKYNLAVDNKVVSAKELVKLFVEWTEKYPIISLEDGLAEDDWENWVELTKRIGEKVQIVGDDFLVTNTERLQKAIDLKACNSILIKINQIGTVTEAINAIKLAKSAGMTAVVSHRSGETEDIFI